MSDRSEHVLEIGGRLREGPSSVMIETAFAWDLQSQSALGPALSLADLAHTAALVEAGVIPPEPGRALLGALLELHASPRKLELRAETGDLYTNREAWISDRTPSAGWLGAGRARREATTTAYHITVRNDLLDWAAALVETAESLLHRAGRHCDSVFCEYTYLQAAQPTTFGHYLLGFVAPILRDLDRLRALFGRANRSPAGCGSSNGSRLQPDRDRVADLLGFDGLVHHGRDAMWQPDIAMECVSAAAASVVNLSRLAEDLIVFSTAEFGYIDLSDAHARASKIMPQKRNPFALSYVRAAANELFGVWTAVAAAGRTPSAQMDNRPAAYAGVPRALRTATAAATLMREVVQGLVFRAQAARARAEASFVVATDLAEMLVVEAGLDFRSAHRVVGRLARREQDPRKLPRTALEEASTAILGRAVTLSAAAWSAALDPSSALRHRTAPGGAAPRPMNAMLEAGRAHLAEHASWRQRTKEKVLGAERALVSRARALSEGR